MVLNKMNQYKIKLVFSTSVILALLKLLNNIEREYFAKVKK